MSTVLDEPISRQSTAPAQRLRTTMAAVRVSLAWLGVRKTLTPEQKAEAAEPFGTDARFLSAGKRLLDTSHPAYKAVTAVRNRIVSFWKAMSLPYPEPGVRLIRQDKIEEFDAKMRECQAELAEAVQALDRQYSELKRTARQQLGSLFNAGDYPESLQGMFEVSWDFPSVEPPAYLQQLNPQLYQQECQRVQERFSEAVRLSEEAFTAELAKLVSHLTERLSGQDDGKPKTFRDSMVANLTDFFQRFRELNVGGSEQLDELVTQAQRAIKGVDPQDLRNNSGLRQHVATEMWRGERAGWHARRPTRAQHPPPAEMTVDLLIEAGGAIRCVYSEAVDLSALGLVTITRASHVEPDQHGRWLADLSPVGGPMLGPFHLRSEALAAELSWLENNWLGSNAGS